MPEWKVNLESVDAARMHACATSYAAADNSTGRRARLLLIVLVVIAGRGSPKIRRWRIFHPLIEPT